MRLYQYMKAEHGVAALQKRRLKISRIHELNDPFEFLGVGLAEKGFRTALLATRKQISQTRGVMCFSKTWKSPVLWAHYAGNHTGVCLGFDLADAFSKKVHYVRERMAKPRVLDEEFMRKLLFSKFEHWQYEKEYRCYVTLEESENGLYFKDFDKDLVLREVAVGYRTKLTREEVKSALGQLVAEVDAFKVRPAFRTFEMAKQRNEALWA